MSRKFRLLTADEIEVRVATANKQSGVSLLLYKDARADMTILDETVGAENWQRRHTRDNANCIVSIWDSEKQMWIEKEDTGTESNTEKEKGLASDSFKRACTNWGIGRELYTAPFIWVRASLVEWINKNGKSYPKDSFRVRDITYDDKNRIKTLVIVKSGGVVVFSTEKKDLQPPPQAKAEMISANQINEITNLIQQTGTDAAKMLSYYHIQNVGQFTAEAAAHCIASLRKKLT